MLEVVTQILLKLKKKSRIQTLIHVGFNRGRKKTKKGREEGGSKGEQRDEKKNKKAFLPMFHLPLRKT